MGSWWFLKLTLKCIDLLAWPLLALGYPLCASVQAIETDSQSDTRNLVSYWILLSLIYLIEYAFVKLLEWLQFWPYIKLIIVLWLIIPDFGRASNVYNHLLHSCMSMSPQAIISRFKNLENSFVKKENFLLHAEKYIEENGTEVLAKLIASKNTIHKVDAEAKNAIPGTENEELPQTNGKRLPVEQKEIKDLEVIEKKEVLAGMQGRPADPNLALNKSTSSAKAETKQMTGENAAGEDPQSSASKNVQKEWPCTQSETTLNSHLHAIKHNATCEALNESTTSAKADTKPRTGENAAGEVPQGSASKNVQKEWTCAICQVTTTSEKTLISHLYGRKHKAACEALKAKNQSIPPKTVPAPMVKKSDQSTEETQKIASASALKQKNIINQHASIEQKHMRIPNAKEYSQPRLEPVKIMHGDESKQRKIRVQEVQVVQKNKGINVGMNHSKLRCEICNVNCTSEGDMASHLKGRKHLGQVRLLSKPIGGEMSPLVL